MKPYYEHAGITIYHGDCREILSALAVDAILTDPPYGIAHPTNYAERGRSKLARCSNYAPVFEDDKPFDPAWLLAMNKPTLLFGANYFADKLPPSSGWVVWDKLRPHELDQATAEVAWTNFVKGVRVFRYLWNGMLRDGDEKLEHPTMKPAALWTWILSLRWMPAGVICDPYMGSGTTLRAAKDYGRRAIGIEIEEKYCEIAALRLSQEVMNFDEGAA
jgi:DNA modification methylase